MTFNPVPHVSNSFGTSATEPCCSRGRLQTPQSSPRVFYHPIALWSLVLMQSSGQSWFGYYFSSMKSNCLLYIECSKLRMKRLSESPFCSSLCNAFPSSRAVTCTRPPESLPSPTRAPSSPSPWRFQQKRNCPSCLPDAHLRVWPCASPASAAGLRWPFRMGLYLYTRCCAASGAIALQKRFSLSCQVEAGSSSLHPRVCCVCAHDAPLVALCKVRCRN